VFFASFFNRGMEVTLPIQTITPILTFPHRGGRNAEMGRNSLTRKTFLYSSAMLIISYRAGPMSSRPKNSVTSGQTRSARYGW